MQLSEIRAVISGGASGLGLAVARHFQANGGRVTLLDIDAEAGKRAQSALGEGAWYFPADVTDEAAIAEVVNQAGQAMGAVNVAVNCAGILGAGRILGRQGPMPLQRFQTTIMVNLVGSFNLAKAAAAHMQHNQAGDDGERGVILNTASVAAFEGQIGQSAYSASKGGIVGMTLPMARELTRFGIRVITIAPGVFHTPMVDTMPDEVQQALAASVPFPQRLGKPEEFAALCAHVVQNAYLNGTTIRLDGAIRLEPK